MAQRERVVWQGIPAQSATSDATSPVRYNVRFNVSQTVFQKNSAALYGGALFTGPTLKFRASNVIFDTNAVDRTCGGLHRKLFEAVPHALNAVWCRRLDVALLAADAQLGAVQ